MTTTSLYISIVQIMLLTKSILIVCFLISLTNSCNIWKASECPQPPTADDEDIFKYDLYTREQLFQFCDQGKKYAECINKRLQCCDLKSEHTGALAAFDVGLQQNGWRLGRYCAGLGGTTIIQYKCKTTTLSPAKTTTTTTSTSSTMAPCEVEDAGKECNDILEDRLRFDASWSVQEKIQWCKSVTDYIQCAGRHITNCSISEVRDDVEQLSNFMEYIMKQANLNCHGGFYGCEHAVTDVRCRQSARKFYNGEAFDSGSNILTIECSDSKGRKWAKNLCYILIIIFNLSTWIDLNSVWIELPLIVNNAPEHWTLPSTLSLVISLANIFPILVVILRWKLGKRFTEIPLIYIIIIVGILACFSIGLFWKSTTYIFGKERSFSLILAVFALAILDCTSSLVYCDYMRRFQANYLHAMFLGESFTATLPTLIALVQGVGGEVRCIENNQTLLIEPIYSEPRFSVSTFFFLVTGIIGISLIAFMILRWTSIVKLANAEDEIYRQNNTETCKMLLKTNENISKSETISLSTPNSMTKKQFYILQSFNVINSAILFGCLPTLITYSLLPYGQKAFYYCSVLFPISYPLSAIVGFLRPTLSTYWVILGSLFGWLICFFIIITAFQSPCPIWADTLHGGILMITAWFISSFVLAYVRVASGNRIKLAWSKEDGLFHFGLSVQMGIIFGVLPMYLVINVYELLKDRQPCVTYCL